MNRLTISMNRFTTMICCGAMTVATVFAEGKLKISDLPAPVQKTVNAELSNATLVGISKEKENGVTQYEIETKVNGKARDFNVDTKGKLLVMEEEVAIDSIPAAARDAIMKKVGTGKLKMVETVKADSGTSYEASYTTAAGKKGSIAVNADGSPHK